MKKLDYHKKCLICNSVRLKTLEGYSKQHLVECENCKFVFAKKIPTEKELTEYYEGYGRNDYLSPVTIKRYEEVLDKMEPFRRNNKILDVGAGIGYFLEIAKKRGWHVYGTEYTDEAVKICRDKGINMQQGKLDSSNYDKGSFDVITSFEVLEHINNPVEEINNFHSLLRQGGLVYITTPNFNSVLRYKLKSEYNVITYPEHLSYYTPKTLEKLFKESGFKKKKIETTGISLTRLRNSRGKTQQENISEYSDDEILRNKIENKKYLKTSKNMINKLLTTFGIGDNLKGWFVKK